MFLSSEWHLASIAVLGHNLTATNPPRTCRVYFLLFQGTFSQPVPSVASRIQGTYVKQLTRRAPAVQVRITTSRLQKNLFQKERGFLTGERVGRPQEKTTDVVFSKETQ